MKETYQAFLLILQIICLSISAYFFVQTKTMIWQYEQRSESYSAIAIPAKDGIPIMAKWRNVCVDLGFEGALVNDTNKFLGCGSFEDLQKYEDTRTTIHFYDAEGHALP